MKDQQVETPNLKETEVRHAKPTLLKRHHNPLFELSEALLHGQILDHLPLSVVTTDLQGRVISWNSGAERLLGYTSDEMLGTSVELLYAPDAAAIVPSLIDDTVRNGSKEVLVRLRRKSGEEFEAAMFLSVLYDPAGRPSRLLGYKADVTQSAKLERALCYESALVTALFDHAPIGALVLSGDLKVELCNVVFERMTGLAEAQLRGRSFASVIPRMISHTGDLIELESMALGDTLYGEGRVLSCDGLEVPCELTIFPLVILEQSRGAVVLCQDISERRRMENRLRTSEKFEALGRLASGIAHDYNNVITAIQLYADLLLQKTDSNDERYRHANEISAACERATGLTERLLAFSRDHAPKLERVDVSGALADVLGMLRPLLGDDIVVVREAQSGLWPIRIDRTEFMQVVLNLAVNARAAMSAGGILSIKATNQRLAGPKHQGDYVAVAVSDDGVGMDEHTRARLFDPLFTTKSDGTGLGLSTVAMILERAGGHIEVESALGRGSTFTFLLPRCSEVHQPALEPFRTGRPETSDIHVLIVDDDRAVRDAIRECLITLGWQVLTADDGISALKILQDNEQPIDAIVADGVMPLVSGATVIREFLASRPQAAAVYMSGQEIPDLPDLQRDTRCTFLKKPFSPATLIARIHGLLTPGEATRSAP